MFFAICGMQAQDQKQALADFKLIVNRFQDFFKTPQKIVYKERYTGSPTGQIAEVLNYSLNEISYDIQKTESIVSPFAGYILINVTKTTNAKYGNITSGKGKKLRRIGFDTERAALDNSDNLTCYEPQIVDNYSWGTVVLDRKYYFTYQDNKWVFKNMDTNLVFNYLYGITSTPALTEDESLQFNSKWRTLINDF